MFEKKNNEESHGGMGNHHLALYVPDWVQKKARIDEDSSQDENSKIFTF